MRQHKKNDQLRNQMNHLVSYFESLNPGQSLKTHYAVSVAYLAKLLNKMDLTELKSFINTEVTNELTKTYLQRLLSQEEAVIQSTKDVLSEDLLDMWINKGGHRIRHRGHYRPLQRLAALLLDIQPEDDVLHLGSRSGRFLSEAYEIQPQASYLGIEPDSNQVILATVRALARGQKIRFQQKPLLSQDHSDMNADKVYCAVPTNHRYREIEDEIRANGRLSLFFEEKRRDISPEWAYVAASMLATKGTTVLMMSNRGIQNEADRYMRSYLIENGFFEGVISLAPGLSRKGRLGMSLLILSTDNTKVRLVDATQIYTERHRGQTLSDQQVLDIMDAYQNDSDMSKSFSIEDLKNQDYRLNPSHYLAQELIEDGVGFEELVHRFNRGAMGRSQDFDEIMSEQPTSIRYLRLQDIESGRILDSMPYLSSLPDRLQRAVLPDKALIISRNAPFKVALYEQQGDQQVVASGNMFFIELNQDVVDPLWVEAFFHSKLGQESLLRVSGGSVIRNLSIESLKNLKLPKVSLEEQAVVVEEFSALKKKQQKLLDELALIEEQRLDLFN